MVVERARPKHRLTGMQDRKLEAIEDDSTFNRGQIYEARGAPLTVDERMEEIEKRRVDDIAAIRNIIRNHQKTPLKNPRE